VTRSFQICNHVLKRLSFHIFRCCIGKRVFEVENTLALTNFEHKDLQPLWRGVLFVDVEQLLSNKKVVAYLLKMGGSLSNFTPCPLSLKREDVECEPGSFVRGFGSEIGILLRKSALSCWSCKEITSLDYHRLFRRVSSKKQTFLRTVDCICTRRHCSYECVVAIGYQWLHVEVFLTDDRICFVILIVITYSYY